MKIIAMYLPQFYRTPENDSWWGDGFTDWVSVKSAIPLFKGHIQPKIPQNDNYYNLLEKKNLIWQTELMHQYGVDGMCIYHYWFKDGRKVLEKPAENLLQWTEIDMPFCFCWANEAWARSWSNVPEKNVWTNVHEPINEETENDVLLEQDYGNENDWEEHFKYMLPFFKDERYIKIDGKPLYLIYRIDAVSCLRDMLTLWKKMTLDAGFPGLYVVGANGGIGQKSILDAVLIHEPKTSFWRNYLLEPEKNDHPKQDSYDDIWESILSNVGYKDIRTYFGGFVGYDDTPRRGEEGIVITGASPEKFKKYLKRLLVKNYLSGSEILFLNAWNEWGEGMYLEPDISFGTGYLEAVREAKDEYMDCLEKEESKSSDLEKRYQRMVILKDRIEDNLQILDKWLSIHEKKSSLVEFIREKLKGSIAIYGYGILGKHLYDEFKTEKIPVDFIVDKEPEKVHVKVPVYDASGVLPRVDNIIVTSVYFFDEIYSHLEGVGFKRIYSIKDLVNECIGNV
ncbi:Glycosyltransferase WbsX [Lachnospiraceae bacterium KH1T2]|nr:Glycosyltransferase WbsX [Lachnospiraceae bacterium KH1T2]